MISNNHETIVGLNRLHLSFDGQPVLNDLSLSVFHGDKVTLTGPSGSGKSTILRCILGLVMPDSGTITILEEPVTRHNIWQKRRHIAYVAQEPVLGTGSVKEVIETPFSYRANAGLRDNLAGLPEIMERFNLPQPLLDKQITRLTGGKKKRISLTIAILLDRPIVLLDEASSALATTIASMATIGLVSLPGMMTGVILAGADPFTAIKYQIAIMIAIFSGTAVTVFLAIRLTVTNSFNAYGMLHQDILRVH